MRRRETVREKGRVVGEEARETGREKDRVVDEEERDRQKEGQGCG